MPYAFEFLFLAFLALNLFLKFWLSRRQILCIRTHRDEVPNAFREKVTLTAHQKAADYSIASLRFGRLHLLFNAAILLFLTLGGGLQWINTLISEWVGTGLLSQITLLLTLMLLMEILELPFNWYSQFHLEARFGFNTMKPAQFIKDSLLSLVLTLVLGIPLIGIILWLWQQAGELWWVWAWGVYTLFNIALLIIYPNFIAPLFNKFSNLPEGELASRIHQLLTRVGFESKGLYVMDASKRNAKGNAYLVGFGKTKRIVFYDTLLSKLEPDEVEAVLAHELGHYKCHHVFKMLFLNFVMSLAIFALLAWLANQEWFYLGLGVQAFEAQGSEGIALFLFFMVLPIFLFPFTPLTSAWSRQHEFEADAFAVKHASGTALIRALVKLFSDNASTLTPDPLYVKFYNSHPDASIRIATIEKLTTGHSHV